MMYIDFLNKHREKKALVWICMALFSGMITLVVIADENASGNDEVGWVEGRLVPGYTTASSMNITLHVDRQLSGDDQSITRKMVFKDRRSKWEGFFEKGKIVKVICRLVRSKAGDLEISDLYVRRKFSKLQKKYKLPGEQ